MLSSLDSTESHSEIINKIAGKRNRSLLRKEGFTNLQHMINSMKDVDIFSERVTRALLFHENQVVIFNFDFRWKMSLTDKEINNLPQNIKNLITGAVVKNIGNDIFTYSGIYLPNKSNSLWFLRFYNGVEFMVKLKEI